MALQVLCGFPFPILGYCSDCETVWVVCRRLVCLSDSPFGVLDISIIIGIAAYGNSSGRCWLQYHFVSGRNCPDLFLTIRYQTNWRNYINLSNHYYISKWHLIYLTDSYQLYPVDLFILQMWEVQILYWDSANACYKTYARFRPLSNCLILLYLSSRALRDSHIVHALVEMWVGHLVLLSSYIISLVGFSWF